MNSNRNVWLIGLLLVLIVIAIVVWVRMGSGALGGGSYETVSEDQIPPPGPEALPPPPEPAIGTMGKGGK